MKALKTVPQIKSFVNEIGLNERRVVSAYNKAQQDIKKEFGSTFRFRSIPVNLLNLV